MHKFPERMTHRRKKKKEKESLVIIIIHNFAYLPAIVRREFQTGRNLEKRFLKQST